jgi:hypothetical protein
MRVLAIIWIACTLLNVTLWFTFLLTSARLHPKTQVNPWVAWGTGALTLLGPVTVVLLLCVTIAAWLTDRLVPMLKDVKQEEADQEAVLQGKAPLPMTRYTP